MVNASSFSSSYNAQAYTCATEFVEATVEGHEGLIVSTDCAESVSVSLILDGSFPSTEHLTTSGASCQSDSMGLSCTFTVTSSRSEGVLTQSPHDISASGYLYTVQYRNADGSSNGAAVNGDNNTAVVNGPAVE